jgi:hypothetical protein
VTLEELAEKLLGSDVAVSIWYSSSLSSLIVQANVMSAAEEHTSRRFVDRMLLDAHMAGVVSCEVDFALAALRKSVAEHEHKAAVRQRKHLKALP